MTKQIIKIYLEHSDVARLRQKAEALGFTGRGSLNRYLEKLSKESIIFLDSNARQLLEALQLSSGLKKS